MEQAGLHRIMVLPSSPMPAMLRAVSLLLGMLESQLKDDKAELATHSRILRFFDDLPPLIMSDDMDLIQMISMKADYAHARVQHLSRIHQQLQLTLQLLQTPPEESAAHDHADHTPVAAPATALDDIHE